MLNKGNDATSFVEHESQEKTLQYYVYVVHNLWLRLHVLCESNFFIHCTLR